MQHEHCKPPSVSLQSSSAESLKSLVSLPPSSNTGVVNTSQDSDVCMSTDWFSFTVPLGLKTTDIFPGTEDWRWQVLPYGGLGYKACSVLGHLRHYFDGTLAMGEHYELSGQACRFLESTGIVTDWRGFLCYLLSIGAKFSRADFATDAKAGQLSMSAIREAIENNTLVSRWREVSTWGKHRLGGPKTGETYYFGSRKSDNQLRIYDKGLQTGEAPAGRWVRVEMQFRNRRAMGLVKAYIDGGVFAIARILLGYLDFKVAGADTNKSRWATVKWWSDFLLVTSKLRLTIATAKRTLDSVYSWLRDQIAPSLALMFAREGGYKTLKDLTDYGATRLKPHHRALLAASA